jgi:enamine deaminase RidA (YjgF/YER057c/UK114 family)
MRPVRSSRRVGTRARTQTGASRLRQPVKKIKPKELFAGAPYAYAAVASPGALVFAAGACPLDRAGTTVAVGDFEGQAKAAVRNLFAVLRSSGSSAGLVLKTTIYVASAAREDLVRVWNVVHRAFDGLDPPSTLLGVAALGYPDQLVEIEAIAVVGRTPGR